jgi:hypothetical protein
MFHDIQNTMQEKTTLAGVSTDVYDTGKVGGSDLSIGELIAGLTVPTEITGAGTLIVEIIQSTTSAMALPDILATRTVTLALTDVDKLISLPLPQESITKQFLALRFSGTAVLKGNAYFVPEKEIPAGSTKHFDKVYPSL